MLQILVLERVDPEKNVHRYYVLSIERTLFGDAGLRRQWGRIGQHGGASRLELHEDVDAAKEALTDWLGRKLKGGYSIRGGLDLFGGLRRSRGRLSSSILCVNRGRSRSPPA